MGKKCSECVSCELTEYLNPFHVTPICHESSMVISDLSLAEMCKCFEPRDGIKEVADE